MKAFAAFFDITDARFKTWRTVSGAFSITQQ